MAIVEDEVRNDSEEENDIEVVEEDDGEQDSGDEDSDDDEEVEALEGKVEELEQRLVEDPYNYDDHIELIQALWGLSELDRWRSAYEQLQQISVLKPEHWLMRIQTEITLAHSEAARENIAELFRQAALDCYSIPIMSEWCSWSLGAGSVDAVRAQVADVLRRAGADPFSGKLFWDTKTELEKAQLENLSEDDPAYKEQLERVIFSLEETVSRPLLRGEETWAQLEELAAKMHPPEYIEKLKRQHDAAVEYLQKITPFEDKLLTIESPEEKLKVYEEYIEAVSELSKEKDYEECDSDGILKVLYDRASSDCLSTSGLPSLLSRWATLAQRTSSRATQSRVLDACVRRCPTQATFWVLKMRQAEHEGKEFTEIKSILETALSKGVESCAATAELWLAYLEYMRRRTRFDDAGDVERLRRTFRLAWDTLAETWGDEANDCEVPLYWARLEYKRMGDPKQGKEIFEEIFKYGTNKTMSKYWEAFIYLETTRAGLSENKLRELHKRALRYVTDYPPAAARLWTDFERDVGSLDTARQAQEACEAKLKEWRESYQAQKEKLAAQRQKGKQPPKKGKFEKNKADSKTPVKGKRKAEGSPGVKSSDIKKKRDSGVVIEERDRDNDSGGGQKRSHEEENTEATENKRQRTDSGSSDTKNAYRESCTLFVSNLEFKVNEQNLRDQLSKYGEIVSLRVKSGVKAFGGSICYCQYKTPEPVTEALKHDRQPLDGRPMFLSRYSSKKGKPLFKYSTEAEKNKLFVKNLPFGKCTKDALAAIFDKYGRLKDVRVVTHKDGKPKGLAYIEYEDEAAAAAAVSGTNGMLVGERKIDVALSAPPPRAAGSAGGAGSLGLPKRESAGGMRRTQLSSFIPSVLARPSTSSAPNGNHSNGDNKPLSNTDFRNLLLKK